LGAALERDFADFADPTDTRRQRAFELSQRLPKVLIPQNVEQWVTPYRLGWLNYWAPAVAEHLGFPNLQRDARMLSLCYRTPSGAWVVKLTEEPLDLLRDEHADALISAYRRFEKVGQRPQFKAARSGGRSLMSRSERGFTPERIAQAAIGLWDTCVSDARSEEELRRALRAELVVHGLSESEADRVTAMTFMALAHASTDESIEKPVHSYHADPIYQALLMEAGKLDLGSG
jgi:hypothetical protein